jgi:hypothetical protein
VKQEVADALEKKKRKRKVPDEVKQNSPSGTSLISSIPAKNSTGNPEGDAEMGAQAGEGQNVIQIRR